MDGAGVAYDVRADAARVARQARFVSIDESAIRTWARAVELAAIRPLVRPCELRFNGTVEEAVCWTLLLDALNFCFWADGAESWQVEYRGRVWQRYYALRAGLLRAIDRDRRWLDPRRWAEASRRDVDALFAGRGGIPLPDDRVRSLTETGRGVVERFGGKPFRLVEQAHFQAVRIAGSLADKFSSFRDVATYNGLPVALLKRAQIFAADLAEEWARIGGPGVAGLGSLTAFADYRIPQILRHLRILAVERELEARIESGDLVASGCDEEIELRACSVHAVELMVDALQHEREAGVAAWILDEYLWQRAHDPQVLLRHHRTVTHFY